ncbi:MAG TPA: hypothetical protein VGD63_14400 [Steroidobacteraceae bacterium]
MPALLILLCSAHIAHALAPVDQARPDLQGIWVTRETMPQDPRWKIEDFLCNGAFCSLSQRDYMRAILADPNSDSASLKDLSVKIRAYGKKYIEDLFTVAERRTSQGFEQRNDPVNKCVPTGFNFAAGPLPIEIKQFKDHVAIHYEFWNSERIVYTDGREHASSHKLSRLGDSIGWYDGNTLIVETIGIEPHLTYWADGARSSPRLRVYEHFTRSEDGSRLQIEKTVVDPIMLKRPLTTVESRVYAPGVSLMEFHCDTRYEHGFQPLKTP